METLETDLTSWEIGPYHGALPAPMRLKLHLDGEVIVSGKVETGYLHRGLEKAIELHPWQSAITYADHLDPECGVFGELAICLAVEAIAQIEVPQRAQYIRVVLSELTRISSHLASMVRMSRAVSSETMFHYVLRDREKILDLFELMTGGRFSHNFLRFGGVKEDVTEGFIERVMDVCEIIQIRLKEYNDLFTYNQSFLKRSSGIGIISRELAGQLGLTGPNRRASGFSSDTRKDHPYCVYSLIDFSIPEIPSGSDYIGDVHGRFLYRLREISQSIEILKQVGEKIPSGGYGLKKIDREFKVPSGEGYIRVESPRGMLGCYVLSDGKAYPVRVQFNPPTRAAITAIPEVVGGMRIEDLPVFLASLDLGIAEADR